MWCPWCSLIKHEIFLLLIWLLKKLKLLNDFFKEKFVYIASWRSLMKVKNINTAWKRSVFVVFLVRIFPHLDWIWEDTLYLSVFSQNARKYGPEKLQIRTFFTQCLCFSYFMRLRQVAALSTTESNGIQYSILLLVAFYRAKTGRN